MNNTTRNPVSQLPSIDDRLLARAARGGAKGRAALAELLERHRPRLRALALRLTRSEAEAEDVVQDTFVAVLEKLDTFRGEAAFGSWVYRVAANFALMRLRSARTRKNQPLELSEEPEAQVTAVDEVCDARLRLRAVERATEQLHAPAREVIALRAVEGLDTAQVARRLGVSEDVVKVRLHRARAALNDLLQAA
jgi:RNA polymerase sigma-70 factor (ECF subfamily)